MRKNEYVSIEEFTSQYVGIWNPSDNHWFGLDFKYNGNVYRLHTGTMYNHEKTILDDGREALFGLYLRLSMNTVTELSREYKLLGQYANMDDLLECTVIEHTPFKDVIMNDATELLGQD